MREPQPFGRNFDDVLGNPWKSVRKGNCCTQKRCLWQGTCREMSSSAATAEKREVNASGLLVHMLWCAGVQPCLLSAICINLAYRHYVMTSAHFPTRALAATKSLHSGKLILCLMKHTHMHIKSFHQDLGKEECETYVSPCWSSA